MSRTRNQLWPLFLLIVCAVVPQLFSSEKAVRSVDSSWTDLMEVWHPNESSSAYRFWLPSPQPLVVTLMKDSGGSRNRGWELIVENSSEFSVLPTPIRRVDFGVKPPFDPPRNILGRRDFVGSNEDFFKDAAPGMWYRRHGNSWQFLTYQDIDAPGPGPIEIVPRSKIRLGRECNYGEGYFTWQPGSKWLACDRRGSISP